MSIRGATHHSTQEYIILIQVYIAHIITADGTTADTMTLGTTTLGTATCMVHIIHQDIMTLGIGDIEAGTIHSTDICTLTTADGTEDSTTLITTTLVIIVHTNHLIQEDTTDLHIREGTSTMGPVSQRPHLKEWQQETEEEPSQQAVHHSAQADLLLSVHQQHPHVIPADLQEAVTAEALQAAAGAHQLVPAPAAHQEVATAEVHLQAVIAEVHLQAAATEVRLSAQAAADHQEAVTAEVRQVVATAGVHREEDIAEVPQVEVIAEDLREGAEDKLQTIKQITV